MLIGIVYLAVTQLLIVKRHLLCRLARLLLHARNRLALLLVLHDLLLQNLRRLGVFVEVVIEVRSEEVANKLTHRHTRLLIL